MGSLNPDDLLISQKNIGGMCPMQVTLTHVPSGTVLTGTGIKATSVVDELVKAMEMIVDQPKIVGTIQLPEKRKPGRPLGSRNVG